MCHTVEKSEIYSDQIFFRQINSVVIYLVNALLSRDFCQKESVKNYFVKSTFLLLLKLLNSLFDKMFFPHCAKEITKELI